MAARAPLAGFAVFVVVVAAGCAADQPLRARATSHDARAVFERVAEAGYPSHGAFLRGADCVGDPIPEGFGDETRRWQPLALLEAQEDWRAEQELAGVEGLPTLLFTDLAELQGSGGFRSAVDGFLVRNAVAQFPPEAPSLHCGDTLVREALVLSSFIADAEYSDEVGFAERQEIFSSTWAERDPPTPYTWLFLAGP